ncbi:hypothetical protein Tco_1375661 [Tanacetum coccineum]
MASNGSERDMKGALSKLLQMGTVAEYEREAFSLARIAEARFEDEQSTIAIAKPNKLTAKADNTKPPLSTDTFGNNGGDESETSGSETPAKEVVDNGNGSALIFLDGYGTGCEVVIGLPEEFQEGDMVDALSRVLEQKSLENWKELDNESEDRKVERDAEREGEPNILAPFGSDRGITI